MGLFNLVKKRFTMQFISIVLGEKECNILVKKIKNGKTIYAHKKMFEIEDKEHLSPEIINYISNLADEYEQTYIILFLNTLGQGIIPKCNSDIFNKYGIDKKSVKSICIDNEFTIYASLIDINWLNKIFQKVGLDFIFSPFLILNTHIKKDTNSDEVKLHMLNTNNGLTIMVKSGKKFLYGTFFNVGKNENLLHEDFENADSSSDTDIEEELFDDLDLDDNSGIDEMQELNEDVDYDDEFGYESRLSEKDMRFIKYLDASMKEFYSSELYDSEFITKVIIYDGVGVNENIINYIKSELFLEVNVESVDLLETMVEIAKEEVMANA